MENYVEQAVRTEAPITPEVMDRLVKVARLLHVQLGKLTEIGEFADQLKKHIFYGAELDDINLLEEIGDGFWYDAIAISELQTGEGGFSEVQKRNIAKLRKRFPDKFTEYDALNRDLDAERKELEDDRAMVAEVQRLGDEWAKRKEEVEKVTIGKETNITLEEATGGKSLDELSWSSPVKFKPIDEQETRFVNRKDGKFLVLRLDDPDDKIGHAARMAARRFAKEIWHDEELQAGSTEISQAIIAIEELLPPLKVTK